MLLSTAALSGCTSTLDVAHVPDRLLGGSMGWSKNNSASQREPTSASMGFTKTQTLVYDDRQSASYPGTLTVTTLKTLIRPSEESLRDTIQDRIRQDSQAKGIKISSAATTGTRDVGSGGSASWFAYNGSVETGGFFARSAQVKIFGEVFQCQSTRTVVVTVGIASTTDVRTIGGVALPSDPDHTTWREIVQDPRGRIEGYRGSNGLAYNVEC